jgi:hypothetical protein
MSYLKKTPPTSLEYNPTSRASVHDPLPSMPTVEMTWVHASRLI